MTLDADLVACADLVSKGDPDRFLATMAAPPDARPVLFALYAMNVEVSRAPWVTAEPMIAEMRLQWWREALAEIAEGKPVRRHMVASPLARLLRPDLAAALDATIAARRWDIYRDPFADYADLEGYIDATAGTLLWAATASLGPANEAATRNAGVAFGLANWLAASADLAARGRQPLPDPTHTGIRRLAQSGLDHLARARSRRSDIPAQARPALLVGWQSARILKRALARPERVHAGTLRAGHLRKRISLMRQAATGYF